MNAIPLILGIGFARFAPYTDTVKGIVLVICAMMYGYTRTHWES